LAVRERDRLQPTVPRRSPLITFGRWLARIALGLGVLTTIGVSYQLWGEQHDARAYPMPGRLVDVGDHRLHLWCIGRGAPTVLMLSGSGTPAIASSELQLRIARTSRVCSYDRAGLGWSDPPRRPMNLAATLADLDALLAKSGERGPFVLVPESFGGLIALAFTHRAPMRVAGIVAVDSTEPESWVRISGPLQSSAVWRDRLWQIGWRTGLVRLLFDSQAPDWYYRMPPPLKARFKAVWTRPSASFANDWLDVYRYTPRAQIPRTTPGSLGDLPLIVISHGRSSDFLGKPFESGWPAAQRRLTRLSSRTRHVIATENGHPIAEENPALVAREVARMIATLRP